MSRYHTQWATDTVGSDPSGWTETNGSVTSPVRNGALSGASAVAVRRRYLEFQSATAGSNGRPLAYDAAGSVADVDIVTLLLLPICTAETAQIMARQSGGIDSYRCTVNIAGDELLIEKRISGVITALSTLAYVWDTAQNYYVRFQVRGTALKAKVWLASLGMAGEPAAWDISITNSDIAAAGAVTISATHATLASQIAAFNFIAVGTGTDDAPVPRSNAEYTAWLDAPNQRCVAVKLQAYGFDGASGSNTVSVHVSTGGYVSKPWDTPASRNFQPWIIKLPNFSREMGVGLSGEVTVSRGDLIIANPREASGEGGVRDQWLRMRWIRGVCDLHLGAPDWPLHDFRIVLSGRIDQPDEPVIGQIRFPLLDGNDALDVPIQTSRFSSGPADKFLVPKLFGRVRLIEPVLSDDTTNEFTIDDGPITEQAAPLVAYQQGVALTTVAGLTISAVNAGTETLTASGNHGMAAGWRWIGSGSLPAPLVAGTSYYVASAGLTAADFRLETAPGAGVINITGSTTGGGFMGYANRFDLSTGKMYVVGNIAGTRIAVGDPTAANGIEDDASQTDEYKVANIYDHLMFTVAALSQNYRDGASFAALVADTLADDPVGIWCGTEPRTVREVLARLAAGTLTWFGQTPDGLFQVGRIAPPSATSSQSLNESNVRDLTLISTRRASDVLNYDLAYAPSFFTGGAMQTADPAFNQEYLHRKAEDTLLLTPPLDGELLATDDSLRIETLAMSTGDMNSRVLTLYFYPLAVFRLRTKLTAIERSIGETVSIEHSRHEFRNFAGSGDDPSPDDTFAWDARKAVVIGHSVDLSDDSGFPVTLTVMRPQRGYYPLADLN